MDKINAHLESSEEKFLKHIERCSNKLQIHEERVLFLSDLFDEVDALMADSYEKLGVDQALIFGYLKINFFECDCIGHLTAYLANMSNSLPEDRHKIIDANFEELFLLFSIIWEYWTLKSVRILKQKRKKSKITYIAQNMWEKQ